MNIEIKVGIAFERRLAELAWESADDLTKAAIVNMVAMQFRTDAKSCQSLLQSAGEEIVTRIIKKVEASKDIKNAVTTLRSAASETITSEASIQKVVNQHLPAAKRQLVNVILAAAKVSIAPRILKELVADSIRIGVADAVKHYIKQSEVDANLDRSLSNASHMKEVGNFTIHKTNATAARERSHTDKIAEHVTAAIKGERP